MATKSMKQNKKTEKAVGTPKSGVKSSGKSFNRFRFMTVLFRIIFILSGQGYLFFKGEFKKTAPKGGVKEGFVWIFLCV